MGSSVHSGSECPNAPGANSPCWPVPWTKPQATLPRREQYCKQVMVQANMSSTLSFRRNHCPPLMTEVLALLGHCLGVGGIGHVGPQEGKTRTEVHTRDRYEPGKQVATWQPVRPYYPGGTLPVSRNSQGDQFSCVRLRKVAARDSSQCPCAHSVKVHPTSACHPPLLSQSAYHSLQWSVRHTGLQLLLSHQLTRGTTRGRRLWLASGKQVSWS